MHGGMKKYVTVFIDKIINLNISNHKIKFTLEPYQITHLIFDKLLNT